MKGQADVDDFTRAVEEAARAFGRLMNDTRDDIAKAFEALEQAEHEVTITPRKHLTTEPWTTLQTATLITRQAARQTG